VEVVQQLCKNNATETRRYFMSSVHRLELNGPAAYLCAQAGCAECLNRLVEHHEGLIHRVLRRQYVGHTAYADLLQEGRVAVWHAILRFDVGRGVAFSSFAGVAIQRQIWRAVVLAERDWVWLRPPEAWDLAEQVEAEWFWAALRTALGTAVAHLPERLHQVVAEYYGLDGQTAHSFQWIGQVHGISDERARQLRNDALVLLRLPALSAWLRELCECNDRLAYQRTLALSRVWLQRRRHPHQWHTRRKLRREVS
jgi:RNA polymerase sigma factor (sigma-70 family)